MLYGQKAREEQRQLEAIYGYDYYQGDVGSWGYDYSSLYGPSYSASFFPLGTDPYTPQGIPYIPPLFPAAHLPAVRTQPTPEPPDPVDPESGRVAIPIPTEIPVFIPEPARPIPLPPPRTEPPVVTFPGPAPIPYFPAPIPARVPTSSPTPDPAGDEDMAIDWGDIFTTSIPGIIEGFLGPAPPAYAQFPPANAPGAVPVAGSTAARCINTKTGLPCKRRRRRRLLTESDFNDLMRIATLPNKQNVAVALAKAVGRR